MNSLKIAATIGLVFATLAGVPAEAQGPQGRGRGGQAGARDAREVPAGTGVIAGRVVSADTGRPLKRVRVVVSGARRPFSASTDDQGRFRIGALPPATYTITASKTGFVDAVFGQRRPLTPGTPVPLAEGQQVAGIDLRLNKGGVITGRVADEDGEPLAQAIVTVLRQQYVRGEKQMTPAGLDQSDDRGQFRVFGLPPGEYYVSATAGGIERLAQQFLPMLAQDTQTTESTGFATTYYPGVITPADATRVKLGPAQELTGVDFPLQIVALATVRGVVTGGPGTVMLLPEGSIGGGRGGGRGGGGRGAGGGLAAMIGAAVGGAMRGGGLRAATRADGTFVIPNVTPGKYTVIARIDGPEGATAVQPLVVTGPEVSVALAPAPGVTLAGTITLEAASAAPKAFTGFRVNLTPLGAAAAVPRAARPAEANERGEFSTADVMPGHYLVSGNAPQGWALKAVYVDGQEVTDSPIEVKSAPVSGVNVIFTNRLTRLSGTVTDAKGNPAAGLVVVAFPADESRWHPQSRYIVAGRTDQAGAYRVNALPPGDYLVIAIDDAEQGEWFDPAFLEQVKSAGTKVRLDEGDQRTQDLKASGR